MAVKWQPERFRAVFPSMRPYLQGVVPELLTQYDHYVKRLGKRCIYARATLKLIFMEATRRDGAGFKQSLRTWGYP